MNRLMAIGAAALLGLGAYAADALPSEKSDFAQAQSVLKAKCPDEFAKIEKLAQVDLYAAMRELRALAKQNNLRLPRQSSSAVSRNRGGDDRRERSGERGDDERRERRGMSGGRGVNPLAALIADCKIKAKYPAEFAAADKKITAAEAELSALAKKAEVEYPTTLAGQIRILRAKAPEKLAAIEAQVDQNPREAMMALIKLADEEKVALPTPMRGGRGFRADAPHGGVQEPAPPMRDITRPPIRRLRESFPVEMKRYDDLRRQDPKAAAKLLRELAEKLKAIQPEK